MLGWQVESTAPQVAVHQLLVEPGQAALDACFVQPRHVHSARQQPGSKEGSAGPCWRSARPAQHLTLMTDTGKKWRAVSIIRPLRAHDNSAGAGGHVGRGQAEQPSSLAAH